MTVNEFFSGNPWIAWPATALYAVECVVVIIIVMRIFRHH